MRSVRRSVKQKVVAAAAVAVLLGGCAFAAVSATGQRDGGHPREHAHHGARILRSRDLAAAASYLGVTQAQLAGELASGKSLAQIVAAQRNGKTAAALVEAIIASRKARLAKTAASLPTRVGAEVQRPGGALAGATRPGARHAAALTLFTKPHHLGASAAGYLGVSLPQLRSELRAGKTLAQLADAKSGKSKAGLIAALLAAKQQRIAARAGTTRPAQAHVKRRTERLQKRLTALVERKFARGASS